MQRFQIAAGLVISAGGQSYEYTDRTPDELSFQALETGKRLIYVEKDFWSELENGLISITQATSSHKAVIIQDKPDLIAPLITDLSEKYQSDLIRKINYIKALIGLGITRGNRKQIKDAIKKIAIDLEDENKPAASTVQTWWKRYERSLDGNANLISKNAYRRRQKGISQESENFLQDQIQLHYAQLTRPSVTYAYRAYIKDLKRDNEKRKIDGLGLFEQVSAKTFYNRIKELPQFELAIARYGYEWARKQFKVSQGELPSNYPLDIVEIDHTLMNLYVIDDLSFMPLGRPWITALKDRNTKVLLGIYISFHAGGLSNIFGAIKHSLRSHQLAFEMWPDLENPWPAYGLGNIYCSDRGADFISPRYRAAIFDLGAHYEYCEVRTPWLKGSIERFFLTLEQTFFETLPGKTFSSLKDRKDYDPINHAVIRFSSLIYLIHKWAVDYFNVTPHSRKLATPLELWNEGIGIAPPPFPASSKALDVILGDRHEGNVRNEGIQFLGLHYADPGLQRFVDEMGRGHKVDYIVTPENLGYINVKHPRSGEYFRVNSTRPDYANGLTLFQHKYLRSEAKLYSKNYHHVDDLLDTRAALEEKIKGDVYAKDNHHKKQLARVAAINSNAVLENKIRSAQDPFANATQTSSKIIIPETVTPQVSVQESPFTNIPQYSWGS